ncbi:hypothetical protein BBJ28_00004737 [Nothophytophthora sp. Chile5]|nr:hypothetical protein BBJ28_00004737 [Nothophytophthora sp. Chile5]
MGTCVCVCVCVCACISDVLRLVLCVSCAVYRSLTVVKNVPALPNNHVFTKQLVDENHALRQETRGLQRRLMQTTEDEVMAQEKEEAAPSALSSRDNIMELARHPLVAELKRHLRDLEVGLERLRQENELLRLELEQQRASERRPAAQSSVSVDANAATRNSNNQEELQECVAAQLQQMKVLEARYQQLEAKTRAKTALYQESTTHLEEMNAQLFDVQQQLAAQTEKLQAHSDQTALVDDLKQENHLLRSENAKLNETVDTLSSRPFDALSSELQKKNLWISQLEEEKRLLEVDRVKTQQACIVTRSANKLLRHRIEGLTADANGLAKQLSCAKTECEQQIAEKEVAQLQLRFYLAPADKTLMAVVGKALKEMKRQDQRGLSFLSEAALNSWPSLPLPIPHHHFGIWALASEAKSASAPNMPFTSLHPTLPIPGDACMWNVVEQHARDIGDKPAFVCGLTERVLTYGDLLKQAEQVCAGLAANGIRKGDVRLPFEDLIALDLPFPDIPPIDTNQVVTLPFSSGTTGRPKGVELTARAMYAAGRIPAFTVEKVEYVLGMLPFFHIMATMIFHISLYMGMTTVVLPGFDPHTFLHTVEKYKIKRLHLAPPLVNFLAKHPLVDKYDLSQSTQASSGGAPLGKEVEQAVRKRLGVQVLQSYGMTEFAGVGTHSSITSHRDGASGKLYPNVELRVTCLETGVDLPANKRGELLFRSPALMKGYFNDPEANRLAFTEDGFLRTGDIGYIDDDGFVFIVDRLKELIKYKGHQVAPAEVEDVVNSHPQVADSGCVRGYDPVTGEEIPKAFVVLKEGGKLSAEKLMAYVATKVAGYKRVREVEFTEVIPKSLSGKILRRKLQIRQNGKMASSRSRL